MLINHQEDHKEQITGSFMEMLLPLSIQIKNDISENDSNILGPWLLRNSHAKIN